MSFTKPLRFSTFSSPIFRTCQSKCIKRDVIFRSFFTKQNLERLTQYGSGQLHFSNQQTSNSNKKSKFNWMLLLSIGGVVIVVASNILSSDQHDHHIVQAESISHPKQHHTLYTWGSNQCGQLGIESYTVYSQSEPQLVNALEDINIVQIATGHENSAAVTENGQLFMWGRGQEQELGQNVSVPRPIFSLPKIKYVACSRFHTCVIDEEGKVWSWGSRTRALGHDGDGKTPAVISSLPPVKSIVCGQFHTLALTNQGEIYAWGSGVEGALGSGKKKDEKKPILVTLPDNSRVKQVAAGIGFSLFLSENGELYSCGINDFGQTGHNVPDRYVLVPTLIRALKSKKIIHMACGHYHAACVTDDGEVFAWGYGKDGQCGGDTNVHHPVPNEIVALRNKKVRRVFCGNGHSGALDINGECFVWGRGREGQLGRGDALESAASYRLTPLPLQFFKNRSLMIDDLSLGSDHSMALVHHK